MPRAPRPPRPSNSKRAEFRASPKTELAQAFNEELERAFYAIGKRLFMAVLGSRVTERYLDTTEGTKALLDLVHEVLSQAPSEQVLLLTDPRMRVRPDTRAALDLLDETIRANPDPRGISSDSACELLRERLGRRIKPFHLEQLIRRTGDLHNLVVRKRHIQLNSSLLVELLREKHAQDLKVKIGVN